MWLIQCMSKQASNQEDGEWMVQVNEWVSEWVSDGKIWASEGKMWVSKQVRGWCKQVSEKCSHKLDLNMEYGNKYVLNTAKNVFQI